MVFGDIFSAVWEGRNGFLTNILRRNIGLLNIIDLKDG